MILDRLPYFDDARDTLQGQAGPGGMPDDGNVGRAVATALERFGPSVPFGRPPEAIPSSMVLSAEQVAGRLPVVSIVADDDFLHDPDTGIMANMMETGPEWERLGWASLWEDGGLVSGSRIGLRIHGDSTRYRGDPSFRLHFRPMYGASSEVGARFLGPEADPASVVVVHVVRYRGHYPNIFVFEIARLLGLPTVEFRPARVFLNGQARGIYVLTERVMPDGWGLTNFGDPDFHMYVYKGETKQPSRMAHRELLEWIDAAPLTMTRATERIDVENLTRHLFTVMFAFTTDWAQGAALLDRDDPEARWFWLHWDMDQSFDIRGIVDLEPWEQPFMELVTLDAPLDDLKLYGIVTDQRHTDRHMYDVRRVIFNKLLEDPAYRDYFVRFVTDALNHELTPAHFEELLETYGFLAESPGVYSRVDLGEYLRRRPDFVRSEVARHFGLEAPVWVQVEGPAATTYRIDGVAWRGRYRGAYFPGQAVSLEVTGRETPALSHWLVNGERVEGEGADGSALRLTVETSLTIEPVFVTD